MLNVFFAFLALTATASLSLASVESNCNCDKLLEQQYNSLTGREASHVVYVYSEFYDEFNTFEKYSNEYDRRSASGSATYKGVPLGAKFSDVSSYQEFVSQLSSLRKSKAIDLSSKSSRETASYGLSDSARAIMNSSYVECIRICNRSGISLTIQNLTEDIFTIMLQQPPSIFGGSDRELAYIKGIYFEDKIVSPSGISSEVLNTYIGEVLPPEGFVMSFRRKDKTEQTSITVRLGPKGPNDTSSTIADQSFNATFHILVTEFEQHDAATTTFDRSTISDIAASLKSFHDVLKSLESREKNGFGSKDQIDGLIQLSETQNRVIFSKYDNSAAISGDPQHVCASLTAGNISALINGAQTIVSGDDTYTGHLLYPGGNHNPKLRNQVTTIRETSSDPACFIVAETLSMYAQTLRDIHESQFVSSGQLLKETANMISELLSLQSK